MDSAVKSYVRDKYGLLIGDRTAEAIWRETRLASPPHEPLTMQVHARRTTEGTPKTVTLSDGGFVRRWQTA